MSRLLRLLPTMMAIVVGATSFLLSYVALRDVAAATHAVPQYLAWAVPVCVDGGILAASSAIWSASYRQRRRDPLAFLTVAVLLATSVTINVHHAGPAPLAKWIAALPPLTLLACLEMVASQHRRDVAEDDPAPAAAAGASTGAVAAAVQPATTPSAAAAPGPGSGSPHIPTPGSPVELAAAAPAPARPSRPSAAPAQPQPAPDPEPEAVAPDPQPTVEPAATRTVRPVQGDAEAVAVPRPATRSTRTGSRRQLRVAAAAPGEDAPPSAAQLVRDAFDAHVLAGGSPDDPKLAALLADQLDVSAQYVRRVLKPLREPAARANGVGATPVGQDVGAGR